MLDDKAILQKLLARKGYTFHEDRQLSDEILLQAGWRVLEDKSFKHGFAWSLFHPDGTKIVTVAEELRPHPILDLDDAYRCVPRDIAWACGYNIEAESFIASVGLPLAIAHEEAPMALLIALFNFKLGGEGLEELGYRAQNPTCEVEELE